MRKKFSIFEKLLRCTYATNKTNNFLIWLARILGENIWNIWYQTAELATTALQS
jgi:hypothetical protein